MNKYIIYQTDKWVGIVNKEQREEFSYENEIIPIRMLMCDITKEAIDLLMEMLEQDNDLFADTIQEELNKNDFTLCMN